MRYKLVIVVLFFFNYHVSTGQNKNTHLKHLHTVKEKPVTTYVNPSCEYKLLYPTAKRRNIYPFASSSEIWLVSYPFLFDSVIPLLSFDKFNIDRNLFRESAHLSMSAIDSLTDILYNNIYTKRIDSIHGKPIIYQMGAADCYMPQNAILFINDIGKAFAYIELCFECSKYKTSSNIIAMEEFCFQKYNLLKQFFIANAIKNLVN